MISLKAAALKGVVLSLPLLVAMSATAIAGTLTTADVGTNLGGWLSGLGQDILIPVAGLFGVGALFRRDVGHALVIAVIAIIIGIFVYDARGAQTIIQSVANTLTK